MPLAALGGVGCADLADRRDGENRDVGLGHQDEQEMIKKWGGQGRVLYGAVV